MAATRTPGITIDPGGNYFIDKLHHGTRICLRLGLRTIEQAELRLKREVAHAEVELARRAHARPLFRDCAGRYLAQRHERRSLATMQVHVRLLPPHLGDLEPHQVHDATLAPFIASRVAAGDQPQPRDRARHPQSRRTLLSGCRRDSMADRHSAIYHHAAGVQTSALPDHLGRAGSPVPAPACAPAAHGDLRDQHWPARQQRVWPAVDLGSPAARAWPQRLCCPGRVVQGQARPCRGPQRRSLVDRAGAARPASGLGVPVSGPSRRHDEQHGLAERPPRSGPGRMRVHDLRHTFACRLRAAGVPAEDR